MWPNSSSRKIDARTALTDISFLYFLNSVGNSHPINTLKNPNGVMRIGGAKEYAAKFATKGHLELVTSSAGQK
jgi:hypothetical protein